MFTEIYGDRYGYIRGQRDWDGVWRVEEFYIYPEYRRDGRGRAMAKYLPKHARLCAYPYEGDIDLYSLVQFYESIGFEVSDDQMTSNAIQMERGNIS